MCYVSHFPYGSSTHPRCLLRVGGTYAAIPIPGATAAVRTGCTFLATLLSNCLPSTERTFSMHAVRPSQRRAVQPSASHTSHTHCLLCYPCTLRRVELGPLVFTLLRSSSSWSFSCLTHHVVLCTRYVLNMAAAWQEQLPSQLAQLAHLRGCPGDPVLVPSTRRLPTHRQPTSHTHRTPSPSRQLRAHAHPTPKSYQTYLPRYRKQYM